MKRLNIFKSKTPLAIYGSILGSVLMISQAMGEGTLNNADLETAMRAHKPDPTKISTGEGTRLSEALNKNLSTVEISPDRLNLLKFIANSQKTKKKGKKGSSGATASYEQCKTKFHDAQECVFLKPSWSTTWFDNGDEDEDDDTEIAATPGSAPKNRAAKKKANKSIDLLVKNLKKGSTDPLSGQKEGDYYRAFKRFSTWSPDLESLTKKVLVLKECTATSIELFNYLGLKAEEYFPSVDLQKISVALYMKVDECAQTTPAVAMNKYVQNARFRLGLLSITQNECGQAQKVFTRLSKMGVSDFTTRALYWSAYCAKSDSKKDDFLANFDELFKTNPLGFHMLSMGRGDSVLIENLSKPVDPIIKMRTSVADHYNTWLVTMEQMDRLGETDAIHKLFSPIRKNPDYLTRLEPGVRLYLSTFAYRAKDTMSLFRILDSVFRTQSEYVVDSTLKLFYPMNHLDTIVNNTKRVNPFLITALIRQESAFQETAKSRVGAMGLMQLMPKTARLVDRTATKSRLMKPEVNLKVGIKYFENLVDRYQGDVELALAAYNAGPEVVDRWARRYPMKNKLLFLDLIPYSETRNYVTLIGRNYYWYSKLYAAQYSALIEKKGTGLATAGVVRTEFQSLKPAQ